MTDPVPRDFHITVLGRTLEHLGSQMYKRRDVAIAELVANCWDAGATEVAIKVPTPEEYVPRTSVMTITDNGSGMTDAQVDDNYLVIGRNRRDAGQPNPAARKVMGRKGVGKLAGFGLARRMRVTTWRDEVESSFELDGAVLKADRGTTADLVIAGTVGPTDSAVPHPSGTVVQMADLKHKTPVDIEGLHRSLARRFSRTVLGNMTITINGEPLREPALDLQSREPEEGTLTVDIGDGRQVTWWAGFSNKVLVPELQGFTILVHHKTAQAPPYFFGTEGTASGQHGTKYLTGVIEADYLDDGTDDDSDRISTDRQEIDWDDEAAAALKVWGDALTRRLLRSRVERREEAAVNQVEADPDLNARLNGLDLTSRKQVKRFIAALGAAETDEERVRPLADTLLRAYEYRQFHDFIEELDAAAMRPEDLEVALTYLHSWKVLESRAILEIVRGRLDIVDKFHSMIVNDSTETAATRGSENLHDLIADYPWLMNPDWQVLAEEKTLTKQLREWGEADTAPKDASRYDFLALEGGGATIVVEIKRAGHAVDLKDLQQIERYVDRIGMARATTSGAFITSEKYALAARTLEDWQNRENIELLTWAKVHEKTRTYYEHYRAVLEGDLRDPYFDRKQREVARTRDVIAGGAYRSPQQRASGIGPQDSQPDKT